MSLQKNVDPRFEVLKRLFMIAGTPLFSDGETILYKIYRTMIVSCGYLTLITTFIGILQHRNDIDYVMEAARPGFVMINLIWMHFFVSLKMNGVRALLNMAGDFTWSDLPGRDSTSGSLTMAGWIPRIQILMWRFNFCDWTFHLLYLVMRGVSMNDYPFFFNAWFPFDTSTVLGYSLVLFIQGLGSVMIGTSLFAVMGLYVSIIAVTCTQLQKIQTALMNIKQEDEKTMKDNFIKCIKHHQYVLRYMKEVENTFSPVLLGPFISVVAALCFTAYTAITISGKFAEIIQIFIITCALLFQIQAFCWFSTELTTESTKIRDAAWCSSWVGAPISFQKSIIFTIAVSNEFTLKAGKLIPVSRRTFMMVLNETYTYLMVLLNFADSSSKENSQS